jgi:hypothetical protein
MGSGAKTLNNISNRCKNLCPLTQPNTEVFINSGDLNIELKIYKLQNKPK